MYPRFSILWENFTISSISQNSPRIIFSSLKLFFYLPKIGKSVFIFKTRNYGRFRCPSCKNVISFYGMFDMVNSVGLNRNNVCSLSFLLYHTKNTLRANFTCVLVKVFYMILELGVVSKKQRIAWTFLQHSLVMLFYAVATMAIATIPIKGHHG